MCETLISMRTSSLSLDLTRCAIGSTATRRPRRRRLGRGAPGLEPRGRPAARRRRATRVRRGRRGDRRASPQPNGLRVAPQGTGHGAAALGDLDDTILLKTERMRGVTIDPEARSARAEAGVIWIDVVEAAAEHGLAALAGSSPDVGVVGYTLGGGLSWLARKHGLGANQRHRDRARHRRRALRPRRLATNEPDLFWALRGGGGAFGIVTAIEFHLYPLERGLRRAPLVRSSARRGAEGLARLDGRPARRDDLRRPDPAVPAAPGDPGAVRGQSFVVVEAIWLGERGRGRRLLEPLRALGPVMDTFATIAVGRSAACTWTRRARPPARATAACSTTLDGRR